ncbi:MAG: signal recognition particle receptor subunit alpha, partial [Actinomycetota bacterium]
MGATGFRAFGQRLRALLSAPSPAWDEIEDALLRADVGPAVAARLVADLRGGSGDPVERVRDAVVALLDGDATTAVPPARPRITLVVGVNGAGKTTTIGKLAARAVAEGRSVAVANADTFRAAASEQLDAWASRVGATFIGQTRGADPGAVAWDAVAAATARGIDDLIVDTAGRLHTREPLMEELRKVRRVVEKAARRAPGEVRPGREGAGGQRGRGPGRAVAA